MIRMLLGLFILGFLAGCVPNGNRIYPEHFSASNCFQGSYVFDLVVDVPRSLGDVIVMTQHRNGPDGLASVCELITDSNSGSYRIYSGEVQRGRNAICASARTTSGHYLSCSTLDQVQRAINAPLGSADRIITLNQWQPYPRS